MFELIKKLMIAEGWALTADDFESIDRFAQLINERMAAMNDAWFETEGGRFRCYGRFGGKAGDSS